MTSLYTGIKLAISAIKYNFKRYISILALTVLLCSLFITILTVGKSGISSTERYLKNTYKIENSLEPEFENYHIVMKNLTEVQINDILNYNIRIQEKDEFFYPVYSVGYVNSVTGRYRYDMYIYFFDRDNVDTSPESLYKEFIGMKLYEDLLEKGDFEVYKTPLLTLSSQKIKDSAVTYFFLAIAALVGVLLYTAVYGITAGNYRYTYGVYMSFGAGFSKLLVNSMSEMLIINLLSMPLSVVVSIVASSMIFPGEASPSFASVALSILITLIITLVATSIVMKRIASKTAIKNLAAADNTPYITPPKRGALMLGYSFPSKVELLSVKRYRKYYFILITVCMLLASMFVTGMFLSSATKRLGDYVAPQYSIYYPLPTPELDNGDEEQAEEEASDGKEGGDTPDFEDTLTPEDVIKDDKYFENIESSVMAIEGVEAIIKYEETPATSINSHVLVNKGDIALFGANAVTVKRGYKGYFNARYNLFDQNIKDGFEYLGYNVTGDTEKLLSGDGYVIISDSFNNTKQFNIKPGDTVMIGRAVEKKGKVERISSSYDKMLRIYLDAYVYEYTEYTVAAVISSAASNELFDIYFSANDYTEITAKDAKFKNAEVYISDGADDFVIEKALRAIGDANGMTTKNLGTRVQKSLSTLRHYPQIMIYLSVMFLSASVLIWQLSQILFYLKRHKELDIYFALGCDVNAVKRLFKTDAIVNLVLAGVSYSVFSLLLVWIANRVFGSITLERLRILYHVPPLEFSIGLLVVALSSVISVAVSYFIYIKRCNPVFTGKNIVKRKGVK